jgi:hypothetical protein
MCAEGGGSCHDRDKAFKSQLGYPITVILLFTSINSGTWNSLFYTTFTNKYLASHSETLVAPA